MPLPDGLLLDNAVRELSAWAYTDSLVQLDADRLRECLESDAQGNSSRVPTAKECEVLICGGDDGAVPEELSAAFPATNAYLEEFWQ